jgi:divalent metal cation (Fe/Co/Zn/Cd) transporter
MASAAISASDLIRRARRIQLLTIIWMLAEAMIALGAAWQAKSPALLGFGGDSAVELFSAAVVFWRFHSKSESESMTAEKIASRIAGALLFVVAGFVLVVSTLAILGYEEPQPSLLGIVLLTASALGMPWLASQKRKLAGQLSSAALNADAAQSSVCGYLSWIALAGLAANSILHKSWTDPLAALILVPFVLKEGWQTMRSSRLRCGCCS